MAPEDLRFVDELAALQPPRLDQAVPPPSPAVAARLLEELGVDDADARDVVSSVPTDADSPWWWCVERTARLIVSEMGTPHPPERARPVFEGGSELPLERRCFLAHVFLAVCAHTRAWHRELGVPEDVSVASLADLGRHMAVHRRRFSATGVDGGWWVTMPLRGAVFDLGRLQFERQRLGASYSARWEPRWPRPSSGFPLHEGSSCLGVHIPEGGRLEPRLVDSAFAHATEFFPCYFPVEYPSGPPLVATCTSWMLDPQLAEYLPKDAHILNFQRRFSVLADGQVSDHSIVRFVFRRELDDLDALPQRTTLERAIVEHLRGGGHWWTKTGWLELADAPARAASK